jgi:hypothetical protein
MTTEASESQADPAEPSESQADPAGQQAELAGPQAEVAVAPAASGPPVAVLDGEQRALLRAVLNRIVPARPDLGGAGDLDVGASIERTLASSTRLRRMFLEGLAAIAISARQQVGADFLTLPAATQTSVLKTVEERRPAFFVALVEHTYRGYYTLVAVQRAVGFDARPPQPLGHDLPPFDLALLSRQRQRQPFWRPAE